MADYIDHALRDAVGVELRHQIDGRWISGVFDDAYSLRQAIDAAAGVGNLFSSLNRPTGVTITNAMTGHALRDDEIGVIVRLPFDFDPARPRGAPSTDAELTLAIARRNAFVTAMAALGWPAPAVAVSGNGAHALYRCRLRNEAATREMMAVLYRGLCADFSDERVAFDSTVRNPARIWRLYGSKNRKGAPAADRPHRLSTVVIPQRWEAVSPRQVERAAATYARTPAPATVAPATVAGASAPAPGGSGDYRTLDVVAWMRAHDLYKRPLGRGKHAVRCSWDDEHSMIDAPAGSATVVWEADPGKWPTWHCSHAHCAGRRITDLMRRLGDADRFCAVAWRARQEAHS